MKKILIFLVMISVLIGFVGMVSAQDSATQTVTVTVEGRTMSFSIHSPLEFGTVVAGTSSPWIDNIIHVNSDNNIAFNLGIALASEDDLQSLFSGNLYMEADETSISSAQLLPLTVLMPATPADHNLKAQLRVPSGINTGLKTGVITYTAIDSVTP